jgi:hypothetical protein
VVGGRALGAWDGAAEDAAGPGEAEAVGIDAVAQRRLMHDGAAREMREEQPVDFLDDLARVLAAARAGGGGPTGGP